MAISKTNLSGVGKIILQNMRNAQQNNMRDRLKRQPQTYSWAGKTADQMTSLEKTAYLRKYADAGTARTAFSALSREMQDVSSRHYSPYEAKDYFVCKNERILERVRTGEEKTKDGATGEVAYYRCEDCRNCPHRTACCKAKDTEKPKEIMIC